MMKLKGSVGLWTATALVVGNMIGAGVFLLPAALAGTAGPISLLGWLFTGAGAIMLLEAAAGLFGLSLGSVMGALVDLDDIRQHERTFQQALDAGRWILVVHGAPADVWRAEQVLQRHKLAFLEVLRRGR